MRRPRHRTRSEGLSPRAKVHFSNLRFFLDGGSSRISEALLSTRFPLEDGASSPGSPSSPVQPGSLLTPAELVTAASGKLGVEPHLERSPMVCEELLGDRERPQGVSGVWSQLDDSDSDAAATLSPRALSSRASWSDDEDHRSDLQRWTTCFSGRTGRTASCSGGATTCSESGSDDDEEGSGEVGEVEERAGIVRSAARSGATLFPVPESPTILSLKR